MARRSMYYIRVQPYLKKIKQLRAGGAKYDELFTMLGVKSSTWYEYIHKFPELEEALKQGKQELILDIKDTMFMLALGKVKTKKSKKTFSKNSRTGKMELVKEEASEDTLAPNITAQIAALKLLDPSSRSILSNNIQTLTTPEYNDNKKSILSQLKTELKKIDKPT